MSKLGIEAGGTKTTAVLFNDDLADATIRPLPPLHAETFRRSGNIHAIGVDGMMDLLNVIISDFEITNPSTIQVIGGFAGMDGAVEKAQIEDCFTNVGFNPASVRVMNDARLMLEALGDGILIVCGTGSNCFGRYSGKSVHLGGYGYAVDDEASGYYIGRRAINLAIHSHEKRGDIGPTKLIDIVLNHFEQSDLRSITSLIYPIDSKGKNLIANLAPLVFKAAITGDRAARMIILEAANSIAEFIRSAVDQLEIPAINGSIQCQIGLRGGIFKDDQNRTYLLNRVKHILFSGRGITGTNRSMPRIDPTFIDLENDGLGERPLIKAFRMAFRNQF